MIKSFKNILAPSPFIVLIACSDIDTNKVTHTDQYGTINSGIEDINRGYYEEDGQIYQVLADGSEEVVSLDEILAIDANGDGSPDYDQDQDGIVDFVGSDEFIDTDNDGIININDDDIDNDGITNDKDPDIDGDGISNINDIDLDGDGTINTDDTDIDGDGIENVYDEDIDGDGINNTVDNDIDGDGINNTIDNDLDGDGIVNSNDNDVDGDGINNSMDNDVDGDGIDNANDSDIDGDGIVNSNDNDVDGDGIMNTLDNETDLDGTTTVFASNTQSLALDIIKGGSSQQVDDALNLQDLRNEIEANKIQLATIQISDLSITLSGIDFAIFNNNMGSSGILMTVDVAGKKLIESLPGLTVSDLQSGLSVGAGQLLLQGGTKAEVESIIKGNSVGSLPLNIELTTTSVSSQDYSLQIEFTVEANGKKQI